MSGDTVVWTVRRYTEVVTPNMFNLDLWRISGHYDHYLENMFTFDVEGSGFGLKVRVLCIQLAAT